LLRLRTLRFHIASSAFGAGIKKPSQATAFLMKQKRAISDRTTQLLQRRFVCGRVLFLLRNLLLPVRLALLRLLAALLVPLVQ